MAKKTLKQVDETKKPVIPQFIADLIEECKRLVLNTVNVSKLLGMKLKTGHVRWLTAHSLSHQI